jgi:RNA polymerase sigma-70 factor (ECF subfamily)
LSDRLLAQITPLIPKLRAYAIVLTRSASDADDLLQDTLLRAWRFREGYAEGTNLKAWLFRILRNEFLRRAQAAKFITEDIDGKYAAQLVTNPDQEFNLRYQELLGAMERLSDGTREALLLTVGAGLTYAEAADACGCPIGTIKSRVNRARELLLSYVDFTPDPQTC